MLQWPGLFEKTFGDHGEELGRGEGPVGIDVGPVSLPDLAHQFPVFFAQNARPGGVSRPIGENRGPIGIAVFLVQLMGELMKNHVVAVVKVGDTFFYIVPGKNYRPPGP